ncbi:MAG: glutathione S-transferase family protein [Hyphomonadaceae bacterium]|nr:MAG: glutathione S-transferase [Caulobacteraceae bacterium]MBT9445936.1 glutathione S-transferase family protein [Hyphomonadaceae bacterium]TPW04768.1 MAG: glutathione S-transferase [Alphaproteobacteria bacterium]
MLTLYHAPQSRSSRIIWLLEELGAPYEIRLTSIPRRDGSGGPDPANPHPDKKVPAIVDNGVLVTESIAIAIYLGDAFPDAGIAPKIGDPLRGPYLEWLAYYAGVIEPVMVAGFGGFADNPAVLATWRTSADVHARISAALAKGPYILGDRFTAADVIIGSVGQWMRSALPPGQVVDDYLKRIGERPAAQRANAKDNG